MKLCSILLTLLATQQPTPTTSTFTIAAADTTTHQIGASGSSCVTLDLYQVAYHSTPNHGLCMTQGKPPKNQAWDEDASFTSPVYGIIDEMEKNNTDPHVIIETITNPDLDDESFMWLFDAVNLRQYGCVDVQGRAAGYTGTSLARLYYLMPGGSDSVQEDVQGTVGGIVYSAQGNIVSRTTVSTLEDTFTLDGACDLAERLYRSLAAVFESDELIGDIRCFDSNNAAGSSIFIHVDGADGSEIIHIENQDPDTSVNPWEEFKVEYEQWRSENPCPFPEIDVSKSL